MNLQNGLEASQLFSQDDRDEIIRLLKNEVLDISFIKKDGSLREMKCTLQEAFITPYERKTETTIKKSVNLDMLTVWDIEASGFKKVNIPTITKIKISNN